MNVKSYLLAVLALPVLASAALPNKVKQQLESQLNATVQLQNERLVITTKALIMHKTKADTLARKACHLLKGNGKQVREIRLVNQHSQKPVQYVARQVRQCEQVSVWQVR